MDYIVREGAPTSLGKPGDRIPLSRSGAIYHELRGHVVRYVEPKAEPVEPAPLPKRRSRKRN